MLVVLGDGDVVRVGCWWCWVLVVYKISLLAEKLYTKILLEEVFTLFLSNKICGGAEFSKRYKKFCLT